MKGQEMLDKLLGKLDDAAREDVVARLGLAATQPERVAILREAGITEEDVEFPIWLSDDYELSDEQLDEMAGAGEATAPWDNDVSTNCCY